MTVSSITLITQGNMNSQSGETHYPYQQEDMSIPTGAEKDTKQGVEQPTRIYNEFKAST
jgi:hypothetical protein